VRVVAVQTSQPAQVFWLHASIVPHTVTEVAATPQAGVAPDQPMPPPQEEFSVLQEPLGWHAWLLVSDFVSTLSQLKSKPPQVTRGVDWAAVAPGYARLSVSQQSLLFVARLAGGVAPQK
jgi:hypothetical protein